MGVPHTGPGVPGPAFRPTAADDPAAVSGHRIAGRLGVSALGRVYLAHAPGGQAVTLTVVRPALAEREGFAARFHRDAQAAGQVHAPSVVPVLGSGREGARYWVAAAYVPAVTLRDAVAGPLTGAGPLPTRVVLRLVAGLAEGLRALQDAGVVHGDLRPAHVLLAADAPRLKEYGFAGLPGFTPQDGEGPAFLAPEQVAGRPATAATDVFALGQIAAYASIGVPPFGDVPARVRQEEPDLNELPGELREIVTRCLIKDPALRPSLAQVATMCAQAAPSLHPSPAPSSWLPPHLLTPHADAPEAAPSMPQQPPPAPPPGPGVGTAPASAEGAGAAQHPPQPGIPAPGTSPHAPTPVALPPTATPGPPQYAPGPPGPQVPSPSPGPGGVATPTAPAPPAGHLVGAAHSVPAPGVGLPPAPAAQPPGHPAGSPHPAPAGQPRTSSGGHGYSGRLPAGHVHLRRALPRRGGVGVVGVVAAVAVAVTAGVALAGGFTGSDGKHFQAVPTAPASAPASGPAAGAPQPSVTGPAASAQPPLRGGDLYQGVRLPAGDALSLQEDPPEVRPGAYSGAFGFTDQADAFASDVRQSTLALLDPSEPSTLDSCTRSATAQVPAIPRAAVTGGSRICVRSVDGTLALVTVRQLPAPGDPEPYVTLDVTVWRVVGRSAEGDQ